MKSAVKTIMVAALLGMLFAPVQAAELEFGFMDTQWATPAKDLKGFTQVGGSEKIAYYVNPQRTYTFFGTAVPDDVVYGFFDDKFFAVYVNIEGIDVFSQIKSYIQHKYGVPNKISRYEPRWFMAQGHINPRETVRAFKQLGAKRLAVIHWGTFQLGDEPVHLPPQHIREEMRQEGLLDRLVDWKHGETVFL